VNRPASTKPDNFFVLLFRALCQRRVPLPLRIVSHSLVLVVLALAIYSWLVGLQIRQSMQEQADALGQTLITQTAASASPLLLANDILSLNVLLGNLTRNPLVAHAAVYNADNHILAEAGRRPQRGQRDNDPSLFARPITFQETVTGHLRIALDMPEFRQPFIVGLRNMGLLVLGLLLLTLILGLRLGYHISTPLLQLRVWLRDPDDNAPAAERQDEIGDLARQLQAGQRPRPPRQEEDDDALEDDVPPLRAVETPGRRAPAMPPAPAPWAAERPDRAPEADDEDEDPPLRLLPEHDDEAELPLELEDELAPPPSARSRQARECAVLAIQLGPLDQLRGLPRDRLQELRQCYRDSLERAASFYGGQLHPLDEDSGLLLFQRRECGDDYLANALCCGELLLALKPDLEQEIAGGARLQLQLGLARGDHLAGLGQAELLLSPGGQAALTLAQYSLDSLLLERPVAEDPQVCLLARLRFLDTPEDSASVEALLDTGRRELNGQLARLREALYPH